LPKALRATRRRKNPRSMDQKIGRAATRESRFSGRSGIVLDTGAESRVLRRKRKEPQ
jgi:hypothetical protein